MSKQVLRNCWVDNVKALACILVTLGHFFQSMVSADLIGESNQYDWFIQTIYYFHVPLFFICSGYLYQRFTKISSFHEWARNVLKKMLSLGIPYFTFSIATWVMKKMFSDSVNTEVGGLVYSLFIHPLSPYWYLFSLFFIFVLTPTFKDKKNAFAWLAIAVLIKMAFEPKHYAVRIVTENMMWFSVGIVLGAVDYDTWLKKCSQYVGTIGLLVFLALSVAISFMGIRGEIIELLMGVIACFTIITMSVQMSKSRSIITPYTMGIYLMHTIFAAGVRSVLFKFGIATAYVHILVGLLATFIGPIVAVEIMKRTKLDFFIEPRKYIRIG